MREVEIRIALGNVEKTVLLEQLESKGWKGEPSSQQDVYFCAQQYASEGRTKDCPYVVRIRRQEKGCALTYKSFTGDGSWMELESGIANPDATRDILERLGQRAYLVIDKHRKKGKVGNIEVNVDTIEHLGDFVEMEVMTDDVVAGKERLMALAAELGLDAEAVITKGYVQLMEEHQA